jgi:hypothetical protein
MNRWNRCVFTLIALAALGTGSALAQPGDLPEGAPAETPAVPGYTVPDPGSTDAEVTAGDDAGADAAPEEPGRGDFDAGGQVRLPSGPDEMGEFDSFNWIALDLVGRYFLLDSVTINGTIPLAVKKPDMLAGGVEPSMIGGMSVTLEAKLPRPPFNPTSYETDLTLILSGAYMREGAMLLSAKDFPLFVGDFQPGFTAGSHVRIKLSSLVDFTTAPVFVYQSGSADALTAVQLPTSTVVALGSLVRVSADLGIFTGDDYSFSGDDGGRIAAGGSLTVKLGPILAHAGAGFASLLTGGMYPTVRDSLYIDLNVKYAK